MNDKTLLSLVVIGVAGLLLWANNRVNTNGKTVLANIADAIGGGTGKDTPAQTGQPFLNSPPVYTPPVGYEIRPVTPPLTIGQNTLYGGFIA